jgi:hypothetical protein
LAAITAARAEDAVKTGPRLVAPEPTGDVGKIVKGTHAPHTFVLRNEGTEPVRIDGVEPACHCTVAAFDAVIPPGGTGQVKAEVDTLMLNGAGSTKLRVHSNDPQSPLVLNLAYDVVVLLNAKPGYARWATTQGESEGTIGNTIWSRDGATFRVTSVESPHPHLRTAFRAATDAEKDPKANGSQWRVELTLDSHAPVGAVTGEVLVHTDHPQQKVMPLPISGFMRPTVFVYPDKGELGMLDPSKLPLRATFKFTNFATEPIAVTAAETSIPGATATVEMVEYGREYQVRLLLPAGMAAGPFSGQLAIRTDSTKAPLVQVPLSGVIQATQAAAGK